MFLLEGNKAPYTGFLISEEQARQLKRNQEDLNRLQMINGSMEKSIELYKANELLYDTKIHRLSEENIKLAEVLHKNSQNSSIEKIVYFGLGAILTGLASYGIYKAAVAK